VECFLEYASGKVSNSVSIPDDIRHNARPTSGKNSERHTEIQSDPVRSEALQATKQEDKKGERMGSVTQRFTLKDDVVMEDFMLISPKVLIVLGHLIAFAEVRGLPVNVTSIISDREDVQSISRTHEDGRALDVSVKGWKKSDIDDCVTQLDNIVGHYGAISYNDSQRRVAVYHNYRGQGDHLHLQVSR
jgi:hypothetical protein